MSVSNDEYPVDDNLDVLHRRLLAPDGLVVPTEDAHGPHTLTLRFPAAAAAHDAGIDDSDSDSSAVVHVALLVDASPGTLTS